MAACHSGLCHEQLSRFGEGWLGVGAMSMLKGPAKLAEAIWDGGWRPDKPQAAALLAAGILASPILAKAGDPWLRGLFAALCEASGEAKAWDAVRSALWRRDAKRPGADPGCWALRGGPLLLGLAQRRGGAAKAAEAARAALARGSERMEPAERGVFEAVGSAGGFVDPSEAAELAWEAAYRSEPAEAVERLASLGRCGLDVALDWTRVPERSMRAQACSHLDALGQAGAAVLSHPAWAQGLVLWTPEGGFAQLVDGLCAKGFASELASKPLPWAVVRALALDAAGSLLARRFWASFDGAREESRSELVRLEAFDAQGLDAGPSMPAILAGARSSEGFEAFVRLASSMGLLDGLWTKRAKEAGGRSFAQLAKGWSQGLAILERVELELSSTAAPASPKRMAL